MSVRVYTCAHVCAGTCEDQEKTSDLLELVLQLVVSYMTWMVGNKLHSFTRAVSTPNTESSLQPRLCFLISLCTMSSTEKVLSDTC